MAKCSFLLVAAVCLWSICSKTTVSLSQFSDSEVIPDIDLSGCGFTKGCYRDPENCHSSQDCSHLLTWVYTENKIEFEISALTSKDVQWTAVGLSLNQKMGYDSVTDCIYDTNHTMVIQSSWNTGIPNNVVLKNKSLGIVPGSEKGSYTDGRIQCAFTRYVTVVNSTDGAGNPIYNITRPYYLFLAMGRVDKGIKQEHTTSPSISPEMITMNSKIYVNVGGHQKYPLVMGHGSLMIIAWMLFASVGILMPRFFKDVRINHPFFDNCTWFQVHRILMILVLILTCIAFILIFSQVRGYPTGLEGSDAAHPILGIIVTGLVIINPIYALLRPKIDADSRPMFNAVHFLLGTGSHVTAVVTMYIGTRLEKSGMSDWAQWVVLGFAVWHITVRLLLDVHHSNMKKTVISPGESYTRLVTTNQSEGQVTEAFSKDNRTKYGNIFKTVIVVLHFLVLLGCTITLIVNMTKSRG